MDLSRRAALMAAGLAPLLATAAASADSRADFDVQGVYLNAAFTHPVPRPAAEAALAYARSRLADPMAASPGRNPRAAAAAHFAALVGAEAADIAIVPSTLAGENMVVQALGVGPGAGVLTDAGHYDGTLALYDHMARQGTPVAVARPRGGRIDLADLKGLLTPQVRLVAVSLISSTTGFQYDLEELCALAHARGALVYADIIQAAGAVPLDLKSSGVDFACAGAYKWLMGEFGAAFLYVRPDRLERLKRKQVGWPQLRRSVSHALPFEPPGPLIGEYDLRTDAAGLFEVGTPAWGCLAAAAAGMAYIAARGGPAALAAARRPLTDRLQEALPRLGLQPLTPVGSSPSVVFAGEGLAQRHGARLQAAGIRISLYPSRMRVSPSIYNTLDDVDRLADTLKA